MLFGKIALVDILTVFGFLRWCILCFLAVLGFYFIYKNTKISKIPLGISTIIITMALTPILILTDVPEPVQEVGGGLTIEIPLTSYTAPKTKIEEKLVENTEKTTINTLANPGVKEAETIKQYSLAIDDEEYVDTVTSSGKYDAGTTIVLTAMDRQDYLFVKWSDGQTERTISIVLDKDISIQPIYKKDHFMVVFNNNIDDEEVEQRIDVDQDTELQKNTFIKKKNVFIGWNTASDGTGAWYSDGETVQNLAEDTITLYAQWKNPFEIAFEDAEKEKYQAKDGNEYFKMQDMNSAICNNVYTPVENDNTPEIQLVDVRDGNYYWVSKLKDEHCWMTQNLDLKISTRIPLTSDTTDLNVFGVGRYDTAHGYNNENGIITWFPERSMIEQESIGPDGSVSQWGYSTVDPYSAEGGEWYWTDTWYSGAAGNFFAGDVGDPPRFQKDVPFEGNGMHGHIGNYYNGPAAIASNDAGYYVNSTLNDISKNPQNSICPRGWRLPTISNEPSTNPGSTDEFTRLTQLYNAEGNDKTIATDPIWFTRAGYIFNQTLYSPGTLGLYWSSTVYNSRGLYIITLDANRLNTKNSAWATVSGWSLRCIAR